VDCYNSMDFNAGKASVKAKKDRPATEAGFRNKHHQDTTTGGR